jgi:phytoene dehydrogenase-like protein
MSNKTEAAMSMIEPKVVVIGGGLGGLAAGIYAARLGGRVTLLERSELLGGRARTDTKNGFYTNLGPHALYRGGPGMKILRELGICPKGATPKSSGQYAVRRGAKHTFPAGMFSMLTTGLFDLPAKLEAARLLASFARIDGSRVMGLTCQQWVDTEITHPDVREFILSVFRLATYANAPDLLSAGVAIEQLKLAVKESVLYIDEGWQTLVDGLVDKAGQAGVLIRTGSNCVAIDLGASRSVSAVHLDNGESVEAGRVIIAATPKVAASLVDGSGSVWLQQQARQAVPVRAACLDVGLSSLPKPKATFALGIDAPLYLSVHSASARLAPDGEAMIHLGKYLPPGDSEPASAERELEALLDLIQPGWQSEVVFRRFLPELTVYNAIPVASRGGFAGRTGPAVPDVPGLFVAGDWVGGDGLLVDATLASAKLAAELAVCPEPVGAAAIA